MNYGRKKVPGQDLHNYSNNALYTQKVIGEHNFFSYKSREILYPHNEENATIDQSICGGMAYDLESSLINFFLI